MIIDRSETPQELAFTLTLPQLRQAHEIYKKHCFFQDFIECCEERRTEETGLCNLPYQTLEHETDIPVSYTHLDGYKRQGGCLYPQREGAGSKGKAGAFPAESRCV